MTIGQTPELPQTSPEKALSEAPYIPPPITSPPWPPLAKRIVALIGLALLGLLLWQISDVFPIVIVAAVLSYLLLPLVNTLERRGVSRTLGALIAFVVAIGVLVFLLFIVVPSFINQVELFLERIPEILEQVQVSLGDLSAQLSASFGISFDSLLQSETPTETGQTDDSLVNATDLLGVLTGSIGSLSGSAFRLVSGVFRTAINIFTLLIIMFYFMHDGKKFAATLVDFTPTSYRNDVRRLLYELGQVWNGYLRGQLILCLVIGILVFIAATILGVPNAPVLAIISGSLEFVPTLGPFIALIPAAALALFSQSSTLPFLEGPTFMLVVIVVWTLIQNIEGAIIVPRVMGQSLNLHPVVILIGVLAGASFGGALGVVLAAPVIASGRLFGHYIYSKIFDLEPFPPVPPSITQHSPSLWERVRGLLGRRRSSATLTPDPSP